MIAASEPQEFVPNGRQHIKDHPGPVVIPSDQNQLKNDSFLAHKFSQVNLDDNLEREKWELRRAPDSSNGPVVEEELFIHGFTVIVSRGTAGCSIASGEADKCSGRKVIVTYTMEAPVKHALWVTFLDIRDSIYKPMPSLCIIDSDKISVYVEGGDEYTSPLQFKIASAWATKYGLLLERVAHCQTDGSQDSSQTLTTLFSVIHPLNEISPILSIKQGVLTYMNDPCLKVVFTSTEPSLCLIFNVRTGYHSIWKIRRASSEECQWMCGQNSGLSLQTSGHQNLTGSNISPGSNHLSTSLRPATLNRSSAFMTGHSGSGSSSLFNKTNYSHGTFYHSTSSHSHSLFRPQSGANSSRISSRHSSCASSASSIEARLGGSLPPQMSEPKPIVPEMCLEYVWSDSSSPSVPEARNRQAEKAFLSKDILGQDYLCYLKCSTLIMARLGHTNTKDPGLIVGMLSQIVAKDAVPIPALDMIVVLEPGGCVLLYTGTTQIGKVHIAGVSAHLSSSSYLTTISNVTRINSPFPKRRSLLSSTRLGEEMFEDVQSPSGGACGRYYHLFFDEGGFGSDSHSRDSLQTVRDPVAARFTLEYSSGVMFRFTLPELSTSPLVTECIKVLKSVLQKDVALLTIAKWYTIRNAPGTQDISPKQEWQLFISALLGLMGYQLDTLPLMDYYLTADCDSPAKKSKKMRGSDLGTTADWNYLISSSFHENMNSQLDLSLGLHCPVNLPQSEKMSPKADTNTFNTSSVLYPYMYLLLFSFHLLYEEIKLEPILYDCLPLLVKMLYQLSTDLRLKHYCFYYWRDYPADCQIYATFISQLSETELAKLTKPQFMSDVPPSIFEHIHCLITGSQPLGSYPYISGVNPKSRNIVEIIGVLSDHKEEHLRNIVPPGSRNPSPQTVLNLESDTDVPSPAHKAILLMAHLGLQREDLLNMPCGVGLILGEAIQTVTENPCQGWPDDVYELISRIDLLPLSNKSNPLNHKLPNQQTTTSPNEFNEKEDQMLQLRFNKDQRVNEVRRLLQSSEPVTIAITQRPEVSDHEFIEEQERHLYAICTRTMALPVGRGMMDLHTTEPVVTEQLNIPRLCLSGRAPPRGTSVELTHIEVVPNMNLWPLFHNGVAAGLRISPNAKNIEAAWILFNKPKNGTDALALPEHAGFLMALGLSGHLNNVMQIYLYNYLNKCHEMTSIGVLLGLAASKRGTMDIRVTKLFSLHIESLLPPTSIELDLVQNIQVAALLGIGLVYQGTAHRHIAEALLSEIGRPPGPEMENSSDRECYSLAAGLGLGLVVLGKGNDPTGLADLDIADTLQYYMVGGHKRPLTGSQKEKYKSPSYQIREGDCVNNHVTGPGATLALGMMYFNTGNMAVAHWLEAPDSEYMLDFVCPDQLLLRMIARGLVLWEHIVPTKAWVENHVPHTIRPYCLVKPRDSMEHVDLETMNQAYCNIIAGACMAMGLRFAGSANNQAFETLLYYCKLFTSISSKSIAELAGKSTIETCICVTLLSLAMVMAGTGDLEVMRLCRHLGSRLSQLTNSVVTYGSHLAVHMALGLLFLGGGTLTLSTSPEAVAALICAFFPRFPTHSNDNRYHLQAFRHLYVLAVEHRLFLPRDIDTGHLCFAHIKVIFLDTPYYQNQEVTLFAPTLLPELHLLSQVKVEDNRYWPVIFTRGKNWHQLEELLVKKSSVGVKLRAGCLPYTDDPHGYKTLLAQTLSTETATSWAVSASSILGFTSDKKMTNFTKYFLELCEKNAGSSENESKLVQWLSNICYECVTRNKLPLLDFWNIILLEVVRAASNNPSSILMWQMKLVLAKGLNRLENPHTSYEHFQAISQYLTAALDNWESEHEEMLTSYIKSGIVNGSSTELQKLSSYLIFYGIPLQSQLSTFLEHNVFTIFHLVNKLRHLNLPTCTIIKIWSLYSSPKGSGSWQDKITKKRR